MGNTILNEYAKITNENLVIFTFGSEAPISTPEKGLNNFSNNRPWIPHRAWQRLGKTFIMPLQDPKMPN